MTFQEYLKQDNPVRMPRVFLEMSDLYNHWSIGKQTWVELFIHGEYFTYILIDGILWTTDEHAEKKSISCFRLPNFTP